MSKASSSVMQVLVHPLVLMQMSEHKTRCGVQQGKESAPMVYGALLGNHNGQNIEIINSFILKMYVEEGINSLTYNSVHFKTRVSQYLEVFPELSVVGIYFCGVEGELTNDEKNMILEMIIDIRENERAAQMDTPLFLKLSSNMRNSDRKVPLTVYEGDVNDSERFKVVEWVTISEESERIGVNHVVKMSTNDGKDEGSINDKNIKSQKSALMMLFNRIQIIITYLEKVQNLEMEPDFDILKEANLLAQRLKTLDRYQVEFSATFEENDKNTLLFGLLPKLTTTLGKVTKVWSKVSMARYETSLTDEGLMRSKWGLPADRSSRVKQFGMRENEDDCFDDEEFECEMGGPRRKIHADSQAVKSMRMERRKQMSKISRVLSDSRGNQKGPETSSNSSNPSVVTDHQMASSSTATPAWGPEDLTATSSSNYVPDAPMPSASNTQSDENIEEPQ